MFTGIVEEMGTIRAIRKGANSAILDIQASVVLEDIHLGDVELTFLNDSGGDVARDVVGVFFKT